MPQTSPAGRMQLRWFRMIFAVLVSLLGVSGVLSAADSAKPVVAHATGSITSQSFCIPGKPNVVCQVSNVSGVATRLGALTGVLNEFVDNNTGGYSWTAVFTMANGDTISTQFLGQVFPPNPDGSSFFTEEHIIVSGTGKYSNTIGDLHVDGTVAGDLSLVIDGHGSINR